MVARLALVAERVENKAVGTEPFFGDAIVALVVFIALAGVLEGAVLLGARELLGCNDGFYASAALYVLKAPISNT